MKKTFSILSLCLFVFASKAQQPKYEWAGAMGGNLNTIGRSVALDAAGNVYTVGTFNGTADFDPSSLSASTLNSNGAEDVFITKFNSKGEFVWAKSVGGTGADFGNNLKLDNIGNLYIVGSFEGTVDFDPSSATTSKTSIGGSDIFVLKLTTSGNFVWVNTYGSVQNDEGIALSNQFDKIYITGYIKDSIIFDPASSPTKIGSHGSSDIFILKINESGVYEWAHVIGGLSDEEGKSISIDSKGNALITGYFNGSIDFDPGSGDYYRAADVARDIFVLKLNKNGLFKWVKVMGGKSYDGGQCVLTDAVDNVYTTGYFGNFVDFNPGAGDAYLNSGSSTALFIQKLDSNGLYQWAKSFNASLINNTQSATLDHLGNLYFIGYFTSMIDFGTGSGISNLSSSGFEDVFLLKVYPSGNFASASKIGGTKYDNGNSLTSSSIGEIYTTGSFSGVADFDPSVNVVNLAASTSSISDAFVAKYSNFASGIESQNISTNNQMIDIFPNPSNGIFTIRLLENIKDAHIQVTNIFGQVVLAVPELPQIYQVSLGQIAKGMYFVKLLEGSEIISTKKIIIE